ncbi:MAG: DNA mismatch repair protein [Eubacteriales bacterium]|nr:DNA mismatch repair protein [Eubacteriales bacterium]
MSKISLLYPQAESPEAEGGVPAYRRMSEVTAHDLGLESICRKLTPKEAEQNMILRVMSELTDDPRVAKYRGDVFADIYAHTAMRNELLGILDKINFLRDYGTFKREYEETASIWDLLHRLDDMMDYIRCVEAIQKCLSREELRSQGLRDLLGYVDGIYSDNGFAQLREDILALRADTSNLKSVTVGINLNERFEACGIGLISVNNRPFTKSGVISNFCERIAARDAVQDGNEWKENYKFHPFGAAPERAGATLQKVALMGNPLALGIAGVPKGDAAEDMTSYMDRVTNHMLAIVVRRLKEVLNRYVSVTITDITDLIPEFIYYIRWAEYIEGLRARGFVFCQASIAPEAEEERIMRAQGLYNLKLASALENGGQIVPNDLFFDEEHRVYLLTGANRGGKTTITQAVGLLFVLAQGGIFVPAQAFSFHPVDGIYTHFPADEDKTMDLGRLGEECSRFRELYQSCTGRSLLLLNETFSTTSFEEGYYIARDSVRAILKKGVRTIYNTHMHKLALDLEEMNRDAENGRAASLTVKTEEGRRSFKVELAPPQGMSFAHDIAVKYGVTYEMLIN